MNVHRSNTYRRKTTVWKSRQNWLLDRGPKQSLYARAFARVIVLRGSGLSGALPLDFIFLFFYMCFRILDFFLFLRIYFCLVFSKFWRIIFPGSNVFRQKKARVVMRKVSFQKKENYNLCFHEKHNCEFAKKKHNPCSHEKHKFCFSWKHKFASTRNTDCSSRKKMENTAMLSWKKVKL